MSEENFKIFAAELGAEMSQLDLHEKYPHEIEGDVKAFILENYNMDNAPYLLLAVTDKGQIFWQKKYWRCSERHFGHIDFFLDERQWGKKIKRVHTRVRRGTIYGTSVRDYHDIVVGVSKKCTCGRTTNVQNTVVGPRCQYCRGSDVQHMNIMRQLGGMPRANGRPLPTNASYYQR